MSRLPTSPTGDSIDAAKSPDVVTFDETPGAPFSVIEIEEKGASAPDHDVVRPPIKPRPM